MNLTTGLLLVVLFVMIAVAVVRVLIAPQTLIHFPVTMSLVIGGLFGPQLYRLYTQPWILSPGEFDKLVLLTTMCLGACWLSLLVPVPAFITHKRPRQLNLIQLSLGGWLLTLGGIVARTLWLTGTIEAERTERGAATGVFTIVVFFAGVFTWTGLAVMSYLFFRRGRITDLVGMLAGCSLPLWAGLTGGQRETTAQVMLTVLMARYFVRRRPPPRLLVVPTIVLAMVVVPVIGEYRSLASERGAMAVFEFDVVGQFEKLQTGERAPEMALAGMVAGVVDRTGAVNYGAGYWNNLVFRFVPAQIVGADLKQSLYLGAAYDSSSILDRQLTDMNGTTMTGIADSYMEFGYLGWGAFLAIGVVQRYLLAACERGSVTAILLSCASSTCAIRALTHQTVDYLPTLLSYTVVLLALAWYARKPV